MGSSVSLFFQGYDTWVPSLVTVALVLATNVAWMAGYSNKTVALAAAAEASKAAFTEVRRSRMAMRAADQEHAGIRDQLKAEKARVSELEAELRAHKNELKVLRRRMKRWEEAPRFVEEEEKQNTWQAPPLDALGRVLDSMERRNTRAGLLAALTQVRSWLRGCAAAVGEEERRRRCHLNPSSRAFKRGTGRAVGHEDLLHLFGCTLVDDQGRGLGANADDCSLRWRLPYAGAVRMPTVLMSIDTLFGGVVDRLSQAAVGVQTGMGAGAGSAVNTTTQAQVNKQIVGPGRVWHVEGTTPEELQAILNRTAFAVLDFSAAWCGPCRMMKPKVDKLARDFPQVSFMDIDQACCRDLHAQFGVRAMPTFVFVARGTVVAQFAGADPLKLLATIEQHRVLWTNIQAMPANSSVGLNDADSLGDGDCLYSDDDVAETSGPGNTVTGANALTAMSLPGGTMTVAEEKSGENTKVQAAGSHVGKPTSTSRSNNQRDLARKDDIVQSKEDGQLNIVVLNTRNQERSSFVVRENETVDEVKTRLRAQLGVFDQTSSNKRIRLVFGGRLLVGGDTIASCGIKDSVVVHMMA